MLSNLGPLGEILSTLLTECSILSRERATPILFIPASQRSERLQRIPALVRDVEASLAQLRALQNRMSAAVELFVSYRNDVVQTSSPVFALPPEILAQIFTLACSGSQTITPKDRPTNKIIGATCARWRAVILSIPKLCSVVDITATSTYSEILECAHLAGAESLTLRLLGGGRPHEQIVVPESVMSRVDTVELTDGEQLDWLRLPAHSFSDPPLKTLCLSATSRRHLRSTHYYFSPNKFAYDYLLGAQTLVCQGILLGDMFGPNEDPNDLGDDNDNDDGKEQLSFWQLGTLRLEGQDIHEAHVNLRALNAPLLRTLWTSDLTGGIALYGSHEMRLTETLRRLYIHGDERNATATGLLLESCAEPKLHGLSLVITTWTRGKNLLSWTSICRIFKFSNQARTIAIACSPSFLPDAVKALVRQNLPRLRVLGIALMDRQVEDGKVEEKLGGIKQDLVELVGSRTDRGLEPVERLRISRTLLGDEDEWFAARVGTLEVFDD